MAEHRHSWKSFTAHQLQRQYGRRERIWQEEYFDRIVRDEKELAKHFNYILGSTWKRWPDLVKCPRVWPLDQWWVFRGGHGGPPYQSAEGFLRYPQQEGAGAAVVGIKRVEELAHQAALLLANLTAVVRRQSRGYPGEQRERGSVA